MPTKSRKSTAKIESLRSKLAKMKRKSFLDVVRLAGLAPSTATKFRDGTVVDPSAGSFEKLTAAYAKLHEKEPIA